VLKSFVDCTPSQPAEGTETRDHVTGERSALDCTPSQPAEGTETKPRGVPMRRFVTLHTISTR